MTDARTLYKNSLFFDMNSSLNMFRPAENSILPLADRRSLSPPPVQKASKVNRNLPAKKLVKLKHLVTKDEQQLRADFAKLKGQGRR